MDQTPEVIRQQMHVTRASLTEKLEALENQVVGTVQDATTAVSDTVNSVKDAVRDTVQTVQGSVRSTVEQVKNTLDVSHCVADHPWLSLGAAVAGGFVCGKLLGGSKPARRSAYEARHPEDWGVGAAPYGVALRADGPEFRGLQGNGHHEASDAFHVSAPERKSEAGANLLQKFEPEIEKLKGLAIGTLFGVLRELLARSVPDRVGTQLAELVDDVARKLGGEPIKGPLLPDEPAARKDAVPSSYSL